jgi:uncharacterized protein (TIGR00251 family)
MKLHIKVKPGSKVDFVSKDAENNWVVKIKAPPVDGKANIYLVQFLANVLELPQSHIQLLKGETNVYKTLEISAAESDVLAKLSNF